MELEVILRKDNVNIRLFINLQIKHPNNQNLIDQLYTITNNIEMLLPKLLSSLQR